MSNEKMYIAQKGVVFEETRTKILVIKYLESKYNPEKIKGKYGLPGGKMDFGESPEETLVREVQEETGIVVAPILPFYTWMWMYENNKENVQIVGSIWLTKYKSGIINNGKHEKETTIKTEWIDVTDLDIKSFVYDEQPALEKLKEYMSKNPFILS